MSEAPAAGGAPRAGPEADRATALERAADHWSRHETRARTRWWQIPAVVAHVNRLVCGEAIAGAGAGFNRRIGALAPGGGFVRAISVGCGTGAKEMALVRAGAVERFDLYEISEARIAAGEELIEREGLSGRVRFLDENPVETAPDGAYDLVYWNNALHHMLDVDAAVAWSFRVLAVGGLFAMDDFVGPSRFQWTERNLSVASAVRAILPERLLRNPHRPERLLPRTMSPPDPLKIAAADPSEAAESERILDALSRRFPDAEVIATGGCIYHLALNDVFANLDEEADGPLLAALLILDETLARAGETHYAVAFARRR